MSLNSSFYNGLNRGGFVAALGDLQILQALPLGSKGVEERWTDGGRGLPEENPEVEGYKPGGQEKDEKTKKLVRDAAHLQNG